MENFGQMNNFIDRFYQEIKGGNDEILDRIVHQHKSQFSRIIWKMMQRHCKWKESPFIFPDNTKFYYIKGDTEILVQEFKPTTRLLKIDESSVAYKYSSNSDDFKTYSLAFPYVVFIFRFVDGMFENLQCVFLDRPLKSLSDTAFYPYLPNVDKLQVCLGDKLKDFNLIKGDITQQSSYILDFFWDSVFTQELNAYCKMYKSHFIELNDQRMISWEAWEAASSDPYFVIDDVEWKQIDIYNFGNLIAMNLENVGAVDNELTSDIFDETSEIILQEIKQAILQNIEDVKSKMKGHIQ